MRPLPPTLAAGRGRACRRWTTGIAALGCAAMLLVACRRVSSAVPPDAAPAAMQPAAAADAAAAPAPTSPCTIVELAGDGRDRQRIDETLASQGDVLRECYAQLHARRPAAAGVARIQFAIDPNGLAGAALMQTSSVGDVTFSYCLAEALTTIAFADIQTGHAMSQDGRDLRVRSAGGSRRVTRGPLESRALAAAGMSLSAAGVSGRRTRAR